MSDSHVSSSSGYQTLTPTSAECLIPKGGGASISTCRSQCPSQPCSRSSTPEPYKAIPASPESRVSKIQTSCITPTEVISARYYRAEFYPYKADQSDITTIHPAQCDYERGKLDDGWCSYVSADGKLYFHNGVQSVVTLADLREQFTAGYIKAATEKLRSLCAKINLPKDTDIVLAPIEPESDCSNGPVEVGYYLANWEHQIIFWAEEESIAKVSVHDRAIVSEPHLKLAARAQFWTHAEIFTSHHALPASALQELRDVMTLKLLNANARFSSAWLAPNQTGDFLNAIDMSADLKDESARLSVGYGQLFSMIDKMQVGEKNSIIMLIASQALKSVYEERFVTCWGEIGSQLGTPISTYGRNGGTLISPRVWPVLSFALLGLPNSYLAIMGASFEEDYIHYQIWQRAYWELKRQWESLLIPAAVIFSANLGFITLSDFGQDYIGILAYVALSLDFFVIIACWALNGGMTSNELLEYVYHRRRDLRDIVVMLSLPLVAFSWSLVILVVMGAITMIRSAASLGVRIALSVILTLLLVALVRLLPLTRSKSKRLASVMGHLVVNVTVNVAGD